MILAEGSGVYGHSPHDRRIEPRYIELCRRLACSEEVLRPISPDLYPGVIVVGMSPSRRIDLSGRDPHRTQSRGSKGRLLAASSESALHRSQRATRTSIRWLVGHVFVAPMVHFQSSLRHREPLNSRFQLFIKSCTEGVQLLIVHTQRQDEVAKQMVGQILAPWHLLLRTERCTHLIEIVFTGIVQQIARIHVGEEELQSLSLFGRHARSIHDREVGREISPGSLLQSLTHDGEVLLDLPLRVTLLRRATRAQSYKKYRER